MKKIFKVFLGIVLLLAIILFLIKAFLPYSVDTIKLAVGFSAKEFCSCLYVLEQDREECRKASQGQDMVTITLKENREKQRVLASFYGVTRKASFQDGQFGCQLDF